MADPGTLVPRLLLPPAASVPPPTGAARRGDRRRVFTGDWLALGCECHGYTDGYTGDLVRHWNGWCVFRTSLAVAQVIVAQHQNTLTGLMAQHAGQGAYLSDAWLAAVGQLPSISWLGRLIVVDRRRYADDDTDVEITAPDSDGLYTIGWSLSWDRVDIAHVHTIHGATS